MVAKKRTSRRTSRRSRGGRASTHGSVVRGARTLVHTDAVSPRAGMYQYGPKGRNGASIWVSGPISGTWYATVKFRRQERDLDARSLDRLLALATKWVDDALGGAE